MRISDWSSDVCSSDLVVIFGEVLPKTYALSHADRVALRVAPVIRVLVLVLAPITHAIHIVVSVILRPFGILLGPELSDIHREEELRGAIELHKGPRPDIRHERRMLRSILDLDDVEVAEVMTHRRNVAMIDAGLPADAIVDAVLESTFTRLPLYRGRSEEHTSDLQSLMRTSYAVFCLIKKNN